MRTSHRQLGFLLLAAAMLAAACGPSYDERRQLTRRQRQQLLRADSAALKVAVLPTVDCLPLFVAHDEQLFNKLGVDVRLKMFTAQMDCDTALANGRVEGLVTDLVRAERMSQRGTRLKYMAPTAAYWQLFANRTARIGTLNRLDDRMVAMTRYSATDFLADFVADSAKIDRERLFKIQVNDVGIRLKMLQNGEIDAVWLAEPQATLARLGQHRRLLDSRQLKVRLGVVAFSEKVLADSSRQQQYELFRQAFDQACDSIGKHGVKHYRQLIAKYCKVKASEADSLPDDLVFPRSQGVDTADVKRARNWLKRQ